MTATIGKSDSEKRIQIGVIGSRNLDIANNDLHRECYEIAKRVGELLAEKGVIVINGGMGGVMEAVSMGVRNGKGITVGLIPSESKDEGNAALTARIATGMTKEERRALVVKSSDAIITISGEEGTKEEARLAQKNGIPVVTIPSTGGTAKELSESEEFLQSIEIAESPQEAVELALAAAKLSFQINDREHLSDLR